MGVASDRAGRACQIALQHEALAESDVAALRGLHERMAAIHWRAQHRHLVTVGLYAAMLAQLETARQAAGRRGRDALSLTSAAADLTGATGAVIGLFDSRQAEALMLASDATARRAHDLEFVVMEGPATDAVRTRSMVVASGSQLVGRWQLFGPEATALDVHAVAAVPLLAGAACLGTLTVLNPGQPAAGPAIDLLGEALAYSLLDGDQPGWDGLLDADFDHRAAVNEAAGMISARIGCSVSDALALIRARAFAAGNDTCAVAQGILRGEESLA
jgi:hypothetical protein